MIKKTNRQVQIMNKQVSSTEIGRYFSKIDVTNCINVLFRRQYCNSDLEDSTVTHLYFYSMLHYEASLSRSLHIYEGLYFMLNYKSFTFMKCSRLMMPTYFFIINLRIHEAFVNSPIILHTNSAYCCIRYMLD